MKHKIRVESKDGITKVFVDGQDISGVVRSYKIEHKAGGIPVFTACIGGVGGHNGNTEFDIETWCEIPGS